MALTPAQHRASDPAAHAWVEANAGTGKTHVLTARVLRLLLAGTPADKILCLTYTRAAAAEMANRVQQRLGAWTVMADDALRQDIAQLTSAAPGQAALDRARALFAHVLELPHGLPIQTIHAFCQSLLGRFPVEAGVPPTFALLDERDAARYLTRARDAVLTRAQQAPDGSLAQALDLLAGILTENQFAEILPALVAQRSRLRDAARRYGAGLLPALKRLLGLSSNATAAGLTAAACTDGAFDEMGLTRLARALEKGAKTNVGASLTVHAWLNANAAARPALLDNYRAVFLTQENKPRNNWVSKNAQQADPNLAPVVEAETNRLLALIDQCARLNLAERSAALLQLGMALVDGFDSIKSAEGLVDYDDLIDKALELLSGSDMAAWVLYKLDGGIDHVLIDEAQDTNPAQWQVVDRLIGEYFAGEGAREAGRTVFAVGDVKQSIYGFQGAAPDLFGHYRARYQQAAQDAAAAFKAETLDLSFRSTQAVLDVVDAVFAAENVRHEPARAGQAGLVALWPAEKPAPPPETDDWALPLENEPLTSPEARLADRIADQIALWLSSHEMLPSRARPVRAGDIMILVRRRNSFSERMVRALKIRGVPVAGIDRLKVNAPLAVQDLLALARFALLPEDDYNLAVLLKGPFIGFDDDQLFRLAYDRGNNSLWRRLRALAADDPGFAQAALFLDGLLDAADYSAPFDFFARALNQRHGRRRLLERLGAEADDPIDELLAQCLAYEGLHPASLQGFVAWIDATAAEVKRDPDQNADEVRVMTVHGAKGLQAPVVFLPDTCSTPVLHGGLYPVADGAGGELPLWYRKAADMTGPLAAARAAHEAREAAEHRRLLYVAMTRAEDRLYVTGWDTSRARPAACWYNMIADAMTALTGRDAESAGFNDPLVHQNPQSAPPRPDQPAVQQAAPADLPAWAERAPPAEATPPRPLVPSRFDEPVPAAASPHGAATAQAAARGTLIHKLLQHLPAIAPAARARAAQHYLSQPAHGIGLADAAAIAGEVMQLLALPAMAQLMDENSLAEVPITARLGNRVLSGQIDRLVIGDDEILVADYKSNRVPATRPDDIPPAYVRQMAAYRAALMKIYPGRAVRCLLVWTHGPALMEIPPHMMDSAFIAAP